ncbi:MAG: hypothetical protein PHE59_00280 [Patescibacteria group bacterium]|nr:hypothetical protein [Patescibacteria group bacterium]MDD5164443.1 hypothetical protein [Patescibacteria group bacterium]MDD5534362.1 hypothetical protein [Patescibacteria group bacterium]
MDSIEEFSDKGRFKKFLKILPEEGIYCLLNELYNNGYSINPHSEIFFQYAGYSKTILSEYGDLGLNKNYKDFNKSFDSLWKFIETHFSDNELKFEEGPVDIYELHPKMRHAGGEKEKLWNKYYKELKKLVIDCRDKYKEFLRMANEKLFLDTIIQENKSSNEGKFPYKLPAGTIWENFIIKFEDKENILIQVRQYKERLSYKTMGFEDKRQTKPDIQWTFLKILADNYGEITPQNSEAKDSYIKAKEKLAKNLQDYFKIDYDPFFPYNHYNPLKKKKVNSYQIKITLIPLKSEDVEKKDSKNRNDKDDLGIEEFYKEQTPKIRDDNE